MHLRLSWSALRRGTANGATQAMLHRPRVRLQMPLALHHRMKQQKARDKQQWIKQQTCALIVTHKARCCRRRISRRRPRRPQYQRGQGLHRRGYTPVLVPLLWQARAPIQTLQMRPTQL